MTRTTRSFAAVQAGVTGFFSGREGSSADAVVMARAMASLFLAGGLVALATLALPQAPGANRAGIAAVCVVALAVAAIAFACAGRLRRWMFSIALMAATVLIEGAIWFSDRPASAYAFYFVWVILFAAYFLPRLEWVFQAGFIAATYPFVVSWLGGADISERWLLTAWTVVVVGLFTAILRRRVDGLIARLSDAARTDPLTGLLNRRGFQESFDLELERARRSDRPVTLLIADLDHFKRVNDLLGHPAGDARLQKLAQVLIAGKRRIDSAARMGGEEFALVLPDTDEHGGYVIAERLRRAARDAFAPDPVELTVSFGVATYSKHGANADQLLVAADQALYVAKELGRDRTALYHPEVSAKMMSAAEKAEARSEGYLSAVLVLAEAVDMRDAGTAAHSETVGRFAALIAAELGMPDKRVDRIKLAGVLHDIGKVGVPDAVLQKAGPLDEGEWVEMRRHCELGARLLGGAGLDDIGGWVMAHHERPDGRGYPNGLADPAIPLESRILAVADAYEAMVADRLYRVGIGAQLARMELEAGAGTQFDREVVDAFLRCLDRSERAVAGRSE